MPSKTVKIDPEKCIGCNTCPLLDPDTFAMDNATMICKVISSDHISDKTTTAVSSCPVNAITIEE